MGGIHDNDRHLADHFGGKLHLGFIKIREKLDALLENYEDRKTKRREARIRDGLPPTGANDFSYVGEGRGGLGDAARDREREEERRRRTRSRSRDRSRDRRDRRRRTRSRDRKDRKRSRSRDRNRDRDRDRDRDRRSSSKRSQEDTNYSPEKTTTITESTTEGLNPDAGNGASTSEIPTGFDN